MKITSFVGYGVLLAVIVFYGGFANESLAAPPAVNKSQVPPPILIQDDTFQPSNWTVTAEATGGATYTVTQQLTGGNGSAPFRFMSHRLPPVSDTGLATIVVTHLYLDASYNPSLQGAITAIDYSESGIILSFPFAAAFSTTQPVVVQGGRVFRSRKSLRFIAVDSSHDWETKSLEQLIAADFVAVDGSEANPDFSNSGDPIQFGFTRSNGRSNTLPPVPSDQDLVIDQGVDNLRIFVHRQPVVDVNEPPQTIDDIFVLDGYHRSLPLFEIFDVVHNDSDPDQDSLEVVAVTEPLYGTADTLSSHTIVYQLDEARASDAFNYTVSDGELASSSQVEVYIDCACTVLCLNQLEIPERASSQTTDDIDLPLIYRVRDQVLKPTADGRRYIEMYYTSNPEILVNIVTNEPLRNKALATVELWQAHLGNLVDGDGSVIITQEQVDGLEGFLNDLLAASSLELQQIIANEMQRIGPFDDYVGLTMKEAKSQVIGDPTLRLPFIQMRQ